MSSNKNCAQTVFGAFKDRFGLSEETTDAIAAPFGSGRYQGETCGCVSAADMVLGLRYGDEPEKLKEKVLEFDRRFEDTCGATVCRDIIGHDLSQEGALKAAMDDGSIARHCPACMETSIEILSEMIDS